MKKLLFFVIIITIFSFGCGKPKVTYDLDGGFFPEEETLDINGLPIPEKEGFLFLGWLDGDTLVSSLNKRKYDLKAMWTSAFDYELIKDDEILTQNEEIYYVYFMRDGCSWCEKTKDDVIRYQNKMKLSQYEKNEKLYVVNLQTSSYSSPILRTNDETDNGFYLDNIEKWSDIYIPSTPALLEMREENGERNVKLIASGSTTIREALFKSLDKDGDYSKKLDLYKITYDLDGGTLDYTEVEFNKYSNVLLPIPKKEGYCFGGWFENAEVVNKIELRNYNLQAKWVELEDIKVICENDIFSQKKDSYIYFVRENDIKEDTNEVIKIYNAIASAGKNLVLYLVYLEDCEVVYRGYTVDGEFTYKIDGVTDINDLYINNRTILIKIENGIAKYILSGNKALKEFLEEEAGVAFSSLK